MTKEEIEETTKLLLSGDTTKAEADNILFDMHKEDLEALNQPIEIKTKCNHENTYVYMPDNINHSSEIRCKQCNMRMG